MPCLNTIEMSWAWVRDHTKLRFVRSPAVLAPAPVSVPSALGLHKIEIIAAAPPMPLPGSLARQVRGSLIEESFSSRRPV